MSDPLVSILVPCFNSSRFLAETIESARMQSWSRTEIIIIDDGSTDGSLELAKRYSSAKVKVVGQKNRGACAARNRAFDYAQGDYIQWLDADDLLHPDKIRLQVEALRSEKLGSRTLATGPFGLFLRRVWKAEFLSTPLWQDLEPIDWIVNKFNSYTWMNPATWLLSRALAEAAGPWDEFLARDQDGEYICRVVSRSDYVRFVSEATSFYRLSGSSSVSKTFSREAYESIWKSTRSCITYLLTMEESERTRTACLKYLQSWYPHFYPEHPDLMEQISLMARELGGSVQKAELRGRYKLLVRLLGARKAKRISRSLPAMKWAVWRYYDRVVSQLESPRPPARFKAHSATT